MDRKLLLDSVFCPYLKTLNEFRTNSCFIGFPVYIIVLLDLLILYSRTSI